MAKLSGVLWLMAGIGTGALMTWLRGRRFFVGVSNLEARVTSGTVIDSALIALTDSAGARLAKAQLPGALIALSSLEEADLGSAELSQALLALARLEEASLAGARLREAVVVMCSCEETDFSNTDLDRARFVMTTADEAKFDRASLRGARFDGCDLRGASFVGADLLGAAFERCICDGVTLPDGSAWAADTDWLRFTQTGHAHFWRADDPASPAYRPTL